MALVILNPAAGGGRSGRQAPAILDALRAEGMDLEVVRTERPGHASELAAVAWERGERRFVVAGGDGTAGEVLNGVLPAALSAGERPWLGFLPLGTGNSFLKDFGPGDMDHALAALRQDRARACDAVRLVYAGGERYFTNIVSMGFAAEVARVTNRHLKPLGALGYLVGVFLTTLAMRTHRLPYRVDDGPLRDGPLTMLNLCNSQYTGGNMHMAPGADTADGLLDLVHVGVMGRASLLATLPRIFTGTHVEHAAVSVLRGRVLHFEVEGEVPVTVDGESLELRPVRVEVLPGALEVCA